MNDAPLVSVIIPCYRQAHYLDDAIQSVLAQTYRNFEIIVVDDGSTDNTAEVAARYDGLKCLRQRNLGLSIARNNGLQASAGEHLVFLDADDRLLPCNLETGVNALRDFPECAFVYGFCELIDHDGVHIPTPPRVPIRDNHYRALLLENHIWTPGAAMFRRSIFSHVDGFDPSLNRGCEDLDLYLRIAKDHAILCHGKLNLQYRKHAGSMSRDSLRMSRATNDLYKKHLREVQGERELEEICRGKIVSRRRLLLHRPLVIRAVEIVRLRRRFRAAKSYLQQVLQSR
ncbi:MAG TPA: glycosyltransferase [Pyrinomonadaceae bacterium]|jgi:glycosyltransferase involved in cell wall biosynthesis|nr:glycosyltransferase [Pyrinomonadaceae bacterium]